MLRLIQMRHHPESRPSWFEYINKTAYLSTRSKNIPKARFER